MTDSKNMTKIDELTRREIKIPSRDGLEQFVEDWAEVAKAEGNSELIMGVLVETLKKSYYTSYGTYSERQIRNQYCLKSLFSRKYIECLEELSETENLPFWKRGYQRRKINSKLLELKNIVNEKRASLKEMILSYREYALPYKLATKDLCVRTGISIDSVYKEIEKREYHFPI